MSQLRPDVYKEIAENTLDAVVFQDPFSEEARKAKRNVVAASFGGLLIAALELQVNGFLGLQTATGATLGGTLTKGLACIVICYFLAGFILVAYVDHAAWKFKRERLLVKPYLALVHLVESNFLNVSEQVQAATHRLGHIVVESDMRSQVDFADRISQASGQLKSIEKAQRDLSEEISPLLKHWSSTISKAHRLAWRLRARFVSLWVLDISLPIALSFVAIWQTYDGLTSVWLKVVG